MDARGEDEREFLLDAFSTPQNMLNAIFLKGYQWPFDPRKAGGEGSSFIDILIYQEEIIRGRRVYLDFTRNSAALEKDGKQILFPAVRGVVKKVDLENRRLIVDKKRFNEVAVY